MNTLYNKRVLLGVTGGIAAYKSAELVRRLREQGADVWVVMTPAACEFITPLTMQALSGHPVSLKFLDHDAETAMGHIALARRADVILVAPATANFISRLANGMADDLLTTVCLAAAVPLLVAPAMNQQMWLNEATQANVVTLAGRGVKIIGPAVGEQACGETGPGRMIEPGDLITALQAVFRTGRLTGIHVMVTAGPTREAIDPVRFISNRSSGQMGFAIARAALEAGAVVTLVSGPVAIDPPERARCIRVTTAQQMRDAVLADVSGVDIFIGAAAVADYRCRDAADQKLKKTKDTLALQLIRNPDILSEVAGQADPPFTVGFAAETESLQENARKKLRDKGLDLIAANQVGDGQGFETGENALEVIWKSGMQSLEQAPKDRIARQLIEIIARQYQEKGSQKSRKKVQRTSFKVES